MSDATAGGSNSPATTDARPAARLASRRTIPVLLIALLAPLAALADQTDVRPQRFSIAISGGASKGAYEAGLNWALLRFAAGVGQGISSGGVQRPFKAASFAGASAGGINSLLSGLTWCLRPDNAAGIANHVSDNFFRAVWLKPDVNRLLPELASSELYREDDAILSRRDIVDAAQVLRDKWHEPAFRPGCRVPLGVTVTRVEPAKLQVGEVGVQNQRFYIPFELVVNESGRVEFSFDPADYPSLQDPAMILIPQLVSSSPHVISDDQVQEAVLTSAAFPLAFGRKQLTYCRLKSITADAVSVDTTDVRVVDSVSLRCPENYELARAVFADGGLFDNLPIGIARLLAEFGPFTSDLPVTYIYLDPNRRRFETPVVPDVCTGTDANVACDIMEFSFSSESRLMLGALDTARRYELFSELTSPPWQHNLSELMQRLAKRLEPANAKATCDSELPFFSSTPTCVEAIRDAARFLQFAYDYSLTPITQPLSPDKLARAGVVSDCRDVRDGAAGIVAECKVDLEGYRQQLIDSSIAIATRFDFYNAEMARRVRRPGNYLASDRVIRVTSLGMPITGSLLEAFGAFLDLKFREYDYYAGVYDAVISAVDVRCNLQYSPDASSEWFRSCREHIAEGLYRDLVSKDARANYVFALLARAEFGESGALSFAYDNMPTEDRDMRLIHEALLAALHAGTLSDEASQEAFFVEREFFDYLRDNGFEPTPTETGETPMLARIMEDSERWSYELVKRMTSRQILLEEQAQQIIAERDPDKTYSDQNATAMVGSVSYILRKATFKYEPFDFTPSVAPRDWRWRYITPYELGFDAVEGDLYATWQPTWAVAANDLLSVRGTLAFAGGIFDSTAERKNYVSFGFNYTRLTRLAFASSFGVAPVYYHLLDDREGIERSSWGGEIHMGLLGNQLRLGLGFRNFDHPSDTMTFTVGVTDIPGLIYWTTR